MGSNSNRNNKRLCAEELSKIADCAHCPLAVKGNPKPDYVLGEIPDDAVGILIGDGPGHEDAACSRVFSGNTGRLLDDSLQQAGLSRAKLGVVNATCCKLGPDDGPDTRLKAAGCCKPALMKQLGTHVTKPKLLAGEAAAAQFTKLVKGRVGFMRGFVREEINAIITWSPSYAFFANPYEAGTFDEDVKRFARLVAGKLEAGPSSINTRPTVSDLRALVVGREFVAVDIETWPVSSEEPWTGKDPTRAILRSIQIGTEDAAISFLWEDSDVALREEVKRVLADPLIAKVWANGWFFDHRVLRRYGMESVNNEDIRDMRCALSATAGLSLREMASLYTDLPPFKELGMDDSEK